MRQIAFVGTSVAIALSAIPHGTFEPRHKSILALALSLLAIVRISDAIVNSGFKIAEPKILSPLVGVVALAVLQGLPVFSGGAVSVDQYETSSFVLVFGAVIACAELLFNYTSNPGEVKQLVGVVLIIALCSSVYGLIVGLPPSDELERIAHSVLTRESYAQFVNRNHFALLAEMGLGVAAGILLTARLTDRIKLAGWLAIALLVYSIIAAGSRGGLVSLAAMSVFGVFVHTLTKMRSARRDDPRRITDNRPSGLIAKVAAATGLGVLVLATIIVLVAFIGGGRVVTRIERIENEVSGPDQSRENRAAIWTATIRMIRDNPLLGIGFGAYATAITRYDESDGSFGLEQAHNDYLEIISNGGIVAGALFAIGGGLVCARLIRNMRSHDRFTQARSFGATLGIFGVTIHSFVDFGLHVMVNALVFTVLIVIGTSRVNGAMVHDKEIGLKSAAASLGSAATRRVKSLVVSAVYLILLIGLTIGAARSSVSNYFAQLSLETMSPDEAAVAIKAQPENPIAHDALGTALLANEDFVAAAGAFESAISLSPNRYQVWLRLAEARSLAGEVRGAESAYLHAIELAPGYSRPRLQLGHMYLRIGDREKAFRFLSESARLDPRHYPEVIQQAAAAFSNDAESIERAVAPASKEGKTMLALYLIDHGWMTDSTRAFLLSDELSSKEKNNLIRYLTDKANHRLAREVWLSKLGVTEASPVFDGGFELLTESDPSGLGWQVSQRTSFTSVAVDRHEVHSGVGALKIRFDGNGELQHPIISQIVSVEPGRRYVITFFVRASELTSGGLPALLVTDYASKGILGRSEPIEDTGGAWVEKSLTFNAPRQPVVFLSLQRPECRSRLCPIFGELSLDDITITPAGP